MICKVQHSMEQGVRREDTTLLTSMDETHVIVEALKYYTDKRNLDFEKRMMAGDMARQIREESHKAYEVFDKEERMKTGYKK